MSEYRTCGDESCHCMSGGEKHGPYRYRVYREGGSVKKEYLRDLIKKGRESDEIRHELEETQNKVADLRRQLQAVNARQEDVGELVEYVEQERELEQRREQCRQAAVWTRAKWWLLGEPDESGE